MLNSSLLIFNIISLIEPLFKFKAEIHQIFALFFWKIEDTKK